MSFTAVFYTFSKRINSTKQPVSGTSFDIVFKAGSDILTPSIKLDIGQAGNPTNYNYCYIAAFNRYYFVSNWRWEERLWTAECKADPMASFKTQIGSSSAYVARAASSYNLRVVDNYYPALAKNTHEASIAESPFNTSGVFILGTQGRAADGNGGAVTYYQCADGAIQGLINYFLDIGNYTVDEISEDLTKVIFNPLQYIVSCMWFPFTALTKNGSVGFGWWDFSSAYIKPLSGLEYGTNISFTIPKHPKAATRGQYLNLPPFSKYYLEAGPWGIIELDPFNLLDATTLDCAWKVDLMTGSGRFSIKYRDKLIYETIRTAQIGVPVQIGQNVLNQGAIVNTISGAAGAIGSALRGDIGGMLTSGISAIGNAAEASVAVPSSIGSNGTRSFNNIFGLMADFMDIADEDLTSRGRPLCAARTISSLSGYILCEDADPEIACTDTELKEIVNYMNSGFYYE